MPDFPAAHYEPAVSALLDAGGTAHDCSGFPAVSAASSLPSGEEAAMEYSSRLERDAAVLRGELSTSFDELRRRMTPGRMVDEALEYLGDTSVADFFDNLARDVREHPLPLLLIGAGIAWAIIASSVRSAAPAAVTERVDQVKASANAETSEKKWLEPGGAASEPAWKVAAVSPAAE